MVNEVRFWVFMVMAAVIAFLVARDLIRDRRKRKERNLNSAMPRGPWYPRFLPFSHLFESVGDALEDNPGYGYKYWVARMVTALLFLAFVALVCGIVWLLM